MKGLPSLGFPPKGNASHREREARASSIPKYFCVTESCFALRSIFPGSAFHFSFFNLEVAGVLEPSVLPFWFTEGQEGGIGGKTIYDGVKAVVFP